AEPAVQKEYEHMIKMLDKRRPQVMIEVTIVSLDTTDGYTLGVEILAADLDSDPGYLTFSSFGLDEVDNDENRLNLTPGLGFNGAVLSADVADVVVHALKTDGRARVVSAPRILVDDNAT